MKCRLSLRQIQVMRLACRGFIAKEMAIELGLGLRTIHEHLRAAKCKLKARTITHAAARFIVKSDL